MAELEFWLMSSDSSNVILRSLMTEFKARTGVQVLPRYVPWETAWTELVKVAIYNIGPDISEIGSTWLSDLVGMRGLRPFTALDLRTVGAAHEFIPAAWQSVSLPGAREVWGIPWMVDTRFIFYRRDLLAQAGIDETGAFESSQALETTLGRLRDAGVAIPWVVPTRRNWITLHNLAVWVWGRGGDFVNSSGTTLLFNEPAARAGFKDYFGLGRFMPPQAHNFTIVEADDCFSSGKAAVTLSGNWLWQNQHLTPALRANIGVVLPPGIPYVGGSHLVVWQHSRNVREALKFIRFLTEARMTQRYATEVGKLPAKLAALSGDSIPFHTPVDSLIRGLVESRAFQGVPLWGMIEDRLANALRDIWQDVLDSPEPDLDAILDRNLRLLTRNLSLAIHG